MLTPEQLKIRKSGITGSDISKIIGENEYEGPFEVFQDKLSEAVRHIVANHHIDRGNFYEKPTAEWRAHQVGGTLEPTGTLIHPKIPWCISTPDFLLKIPSKSKKLDLSIKVPSPSTRHKWGRPGTDEAPRSAVVQVQWEMIILKELYGIDEAEIVAPLDGELAVYPVKANPKFQNLLLVAAEKFWTENVLKRVPPEPDGTEGCAKFLDQHYKPTPKAVVAADPEAEQLLALYRATRLTAKQAEEEQLRLENLIKGKLAKLNASVMTSSSTGARFTWSQYERTNVKYKAIVDELDVPPEVRAKHTEKNPQSKITFVCPGDK